MSVMAEAVTALRSETDADEPARSSDFEVFFAEQHGRLFRALALLTRDRNEAEEIMQDAFLAVWERWEHVANGPDPVAYLFRTALNGWRSRGRRAALAVRRVIHKIPNDDEMAVVEQRDAVVRALAGLPARQRAAIVLMDVLDLSSEQAGGVLGISAVTVRVLAGRARATLAKEMGDRDE
jgi:RNA polymerase sigma factor (sigma-70 family)